MGKGESFNDVFKRANTFLNKLIMTHFLNKSDPDMHKVNPKLFS